MNTNNLAQKTNFSAGSDKLEFSNLFLTAVNIPGINLSHPEVQGRSGTNMFLAANTMTFNDLSFTLLLDEDFKIYHEFLQKVFDNINPTTGSTANIEFDFWVEISNNMGNKLFKLEFTNCRVESIGDINLETQSDETEFTLDVTVKYDSFKVVNDALNVPAIIV